MSVQPYVRKRDRHLYTRLKKAYENEGSLHLYAGDVARIMNLFAALDVPTAEKFDIHTADGYARLQAGTWMPMEDMPSVASIVSAVDRHEITWSFLTVDMKEIPTIMGGPKGCEEMVLRMVDSGILRLVPDGYVDHRQIHPVKLAPKKPPGQPFARLDWVAEKPDPDSFFPPKPMFGKVMNVDFDTVENKWLINLCVYTASGHRAGRVSPACGGPTGYEPSLRADRFALIAIPDFPVKQDRATGGYKLKYL